MTFFEKMFAGGSSASYGRWASFMALCCLLLWVSIIVNRTGGIPAIPETWLLVILGPFGISKFGEVFTSVKGASDGNSATP